jgi:uncharacterized protein (TIGR03435 family)
MMRSGMIVRPLCVFALAASAQTAQPAFDVATVKPNHSGSRGSVAPGARNGQFKGENNSLKTLLSAAYAIPEFQVQGPDWLKTALFDIAAKPPDGTTPDRIMPMLRTLLEDRFHLQTHREMAEMNIYALAVGKGGSKLPEFRAGEPMKPPTFLPGASMMMSNGPLEQFAGQLAPKVGRPVVNKTGLTGAFHVVLSYSPPSSAAARDASDPGADLFTAIQEQLGLCWSLRKGPLRFSRSTTRKRFQTGIRLAASG